MSAIEAIVFDLDGVLVETRHFHFQSLNKALDAIYPAGVLDYAEHLAKYDGRPTKVKLQLLSQEKGLPVELHSAIWLMKQEETQKLLDTALRVSPRLVSLCESLKHLGFRLFCASNSTAPTVTKALSQIGLLPFMERAYSTLDVRHPKPHPEMYLKVVMDGGLNPKNVLVCEDSAVGRRAALDSGCNLCPVESPEDLTLGLILKHVHYYRTLKQQLTSLPWISNPRMNVVIPMAGEGRRFQKAFPMIKPLIPVRGKLMIQIVVDNLNIAARHIFICQEQHIRDYRLDVWLPVLTQASKGQSCQIVTLPALTEGPACTVMAASGELNLDEPLLIANSDQFVEWDIHEFLYRAQAPDVDGAILTFPCEARDPKWSYARLSETTGFVSEVKEKVAISAEATVGIYFWRKTSDFIRYTQAMIDQNIRVNNEFYVCPVYNLAIEDGKKIMAVRCKRMWGLGTPSDVQHFVENYKGLV